MIGGSPFYDFRAGKGDTRAVEQGHDDPCWGPGHVRDSERGKQRQKRRPLPDEMRAFTRTTHVPHPTRGVKVNP
jgi:hypothetical protein